MNYEFSIKGFDGPLDLLLHLVKKENINIYDINIEQITTQYLNYINKMQEMNLDIASEYLVLASELLEIKSSALLPKQEAEKGEEIEEDPKEQLIKRLIEYEQYKNISELFRNLESYRMNVFTKKQDSLLEYQETTNEIIDYGIDINDLVNAMNNVLKEKILEKPIKTKISTKEYNMGKRCIEIRDILRKKKKVNFIDLFTEFNKDFIVITFLAILSMSRKQEIEIQQENNFKNILIKEKGDNN